MHNKPDRDRETLSTDPRDDSPKQSEGPMPSSGMPSSGMAYRQTARSMLDEMIKRHRERAYKLEVLSKTLPLELSPEADEALWMILVSYRNL